MDVYLLKWNEQHPTKKREYHLKRDPMEANKRSRDWYKANTERAKNNVRQYHKREPDKRSVHHHIRRARKRGAEGQFTASDWREIVKRQGSKCVICNIKCKLTKDHIVALAVGGSNWPTNIQGLCMSCNARKGAR